MSEKKGIKMIGVNPDVHREIKIIAAQENRSIGKQIEYMLQQALKERSK